MLISRNFILIVLSFIALYAKGANDTPSIQIYPNPSDGKFHCIVNYENGNDSLELIIYNLQGQQVYSKYMQVSGKTDIYIDLSNLNQSGVYIVTFHFFKLNITLNRKVIIDKTGGDNRNNQFRISHYDLNLSIRNLSNKHISGTAGLHIISQTDSLKTIRLDLLKLPVSRVYSTTDSILFSYNDTLLTLNLEHSLMQNDSMLVYIDYSGNPVMDAKWGGFYFSGNYAFNMGVGFQSIPHNFGRCWFPCVDNFTMKSTYSFHVRTDSSWKAICNGLMLPSQPHIDGSITWNWQQNQPIPTYLASVAIGKYEIIKSEYVGINRTIPVWIATEAKDTANTKLSMKKLPDAIRCFEEKFGAYPFDRVGFVGVPFGSGAMEHAANIAYPLYALDGTTNNETLFAHELSHMWWGNLVTCKTDADMWLNEGWASFCESLFLEFVYGKEAYNADIKTKLDYVLLNAAKRDSGFYPVSGIPKNITYGTHVYDKGALVVHSLRSFMGDSVFFDACKQYLKQFPYGNGTSEDMLQEFQKFTGKDLSNFFQGWVYEKGFESIFLKQVSVVNRVVSLTLNKLIRYRSYPTSEISVQVDLYALNGAQQTELLHLNKAEQTFEITLHGQMRDLAYVVINPSNLMALGRTQDKLSIKSNGTYLLKNQYTTITVTACPDSAQLVSEMHLTEPTQSGLREKGIRISKERFWHMDGHLPESFKANLAFDYDGRKFSYLDEELLSTMSTEDSLVLLYKSHDMQEWQIHTDNTYLPGASKTDKSGRFKVNELKKGFYAFGLRDYKTSGIQSIDKKIPNAINLYPNPAKDKVQISFEKAFTGNLIVSDIQGKIVYQEMLKQSKNLVIDVSDYRKGVYFITTDANSGKISTRFLVK